VGQQCVNGGRCCSGACDGNTRVCLASAPTARPRAPTARAQPTSPPSQPTYTPFPTAAPTQAYNDTGENICVPNSCMTRECSWAGSSQCSSWGGGCSGPAERCYCCVTRYSGGPCCGGNIGVNPEPTAAPPSCVNMVYTFGADKLESTYYSAEPNQPTQIYACRDNASSNRGWDNVFFYYQFSANNDFTSASWVQIPGASVASWPGCDFGYSVTLTPDSVGYYNVALYTATSVRCNQEQIISMGSCNIQGYKMTSPLRSPMDPIPADIANQTVTLDTGGTGRVTTNTNPYFFVGLRPREYAVTVGPVPSAYTRVGASLCYDDITCHNDGNVVWGNSTGAGAYLNTISCAGGYADLYWHYCPKPATTSNMYPNSVLTGTAATLMAGGDPVLSWAKTSNTSQYILRIDDTTNPWSGDCSALNPGDYCDDNMSPYHDSTTVYYNPVSEIGFVPVYGKSYHWWVHSQNSCDETYWGARGDANFCLDSTDCSLACGQPTQCSGNCSNAATLAPGAVSIVSPNGGVSTPTRLGQGNVTLEWQNNETNHTYTTSYTVVVWNVATNAVEYILGSIPKTQNTLTLTPFDFYYGQQAGGVYRWTIQASNTTCLSFGTNTISPVSQGYFKLNAIPVASQVSLTQFNNTPITADISLRNHVCENVFSTSTESVKQNKFVFTITDADGVVDINSGNMDFVGQGSGLNVLTLSAVRNGLFWDLVKSGSQSGNITINTANSSATYTGANEITVVVALDYDVASFNPEIYRLRAYGTDNYNTGATTATARVLKVWSCVIPVSGTVYEATSGTANCGNGSGFTNAYGRSDFRVLQYRPSAGFTTDKNMTVLDPVGGSYASTTTPNHLVWGTSYAPNFTIDGIKWSEARATQIGSGASACVSSSSINMSSNSTFFNPYSNNTSLDVDFSIIKNFDGWWQVNDGSTISNNSTVNSIPPLCGYLSALCFPGVGTTTTPVSEGVVVANAINSNSGCGTGCKDGAPNWYVDNKNYLRDPIYYDEMYARITSEKGYGIVLTPPSGQKYLFSQLLGQNPVGGKIFFVDGVLDIDVNNTLGAGEYMLVVAKDIEVRINVTNLDGAFIALDTRASGRRANFTALDSTRDAQGDPNQPVSNQLVINGLVYANGDVRFLRTINSSDGVTITANAKQWNNSNPAVKINHRPEVMFLMPGIFNSMKVSWRTK